MLPQDDWLPQAQRLAIGMRMRVVHGRERTAAMTVANERDRWWAYCQRCKAGGVVEKSHVLLSAPLEVSEHELRVPSDLRPVLGSDYQDTVGRFLARKGMMFPYLPKLWYSLSTKRLCLQDDTGGWHGRDMTERSQAKWLHYAKPHIVGCVAPCTILTEDIFSMYKVRYAVRDTGYGTATTLGAGCSTSAALALKNCTTLVWAYDDDEAGDRGARSARKRMQLLVPKQFRARPPDGLDPKDMHCADIRELIEGALHARFDF